MGKILILSNSGNFKKLLQRLSKIVKDYQRLPKIVKDYQRLPKIVKDYQRFYSFDKVAVQIKICS